MRSFSLKSKLNVATFERFASVLRAILQLLFLPLPQSPLLDFRTPKQTFSIKNNRPENWLAGYALFSCFISSKTFDQQGRSLHILGGGGGYVVFKMHLSVYISFVDLNHLLQTFVLELVSEAFCFAGILFGNCSILVSGFTYCHVNSYVTKSDTRDLLS